MLLCTEAMPFSLMVRCDMLNAAHTRWAYDCWDTTSDLPSSQSNTGLAPAKYNRYNFYQYSLLKQCSQPLRLTPS